MPTNTTQKPAAIPYALMLQQKRKHAGVSDADLIAALATEFHLKEETAVKLITGQQLMRLPHLEFIIGLLKLPAKDNAELRAAHAWSELNINPVPSDPFRQALHQKIDSAIARGQISRGGIATALAEAFDLLPTSTYRWLKEKGTWEGPKLEFLIRTLKLEEKGADELRFTRFPLLKRQDPATLTHDDLSLHIKCLLKTIRQIMDKSQAEMGSFHGISTSVYEAWENENTKKIPPLERVQKIKDQLSLPSPYEERFSFLKADLVEAVKLRENPVIEKSVRIPAASTKPVPAPSALLPQIQHIKPAEIPGGGGHGFTPAPANGAALGQLKPPPMPPGAAYAPAMTGRR